MPAPSHFQTLYRIATALCVICVLTTATVCHAQSIQPPSRQYQPIRNAPPNVHVPDGAARQMPQDVRQMQMRQMQMTRAAAQRSSASQGTSNTPGTQFTFSDQGTSTTNQGRPGTGSQPYESPQQPGTVRQVGYQEDLSTQSSQRRLPSSVNPNAPAVDSSQLIPGGRQPSAGQLPGRPAVDNAGDFNPERYLPSASTANQLPETMPNGRNAINQVRSTSYESDAGTGSEGSTIVLVGSDAANGEATQDGPVARTANAQPLRGQAYDPETIQLRSESTGVMAATPRQPITVRNDLAEYNANAQAAIDLVAPSIQVQTYGPQSIGINKAANFTVKVTNNGSFDADQILVGIDIPEWVDVTDLNVTTGTHKITDGAEQARLIWTVDRIPANSTQSISIKTTPRRPEMFDMKVEWTFLPRVGRTNVQVTQPKLEMTISGPTDVLYGEKATYHVEVRNPGTGTAENVRVKLPEALGGESQLLGDIEPGKSTKFQIELFARTAGELDLAAMAMGNDGLEAKVDRKVLVRRAKLNVAVQGPSQKYSGTDGKYTVTVANEGDAIAADVVAALALPPGVEYLGGLDGAELIESGLRWTVGSLSPGEQQSYTIHCMLNTSGGIQIEAGARGAGDLAAAAQCVTTIQTVADLILSVNDPRGPLPTGEDVAYLIKIKNRGTKAATNVNLVMHFSEGIEPTSAVGVQNRVGPGEVVFEPIPKVEPGQELTVTVHAQATTAGTHIFRAQLTCDDSDSREIAEGTTRFYGDTIPVQTDSGQTINQEQPIQQDDRTADESNEFVPNQIRK